VLEVVDPSLVEKFQVRESYMVPTHREWYKALGFGGREHSGGGGGDMRFIITPH
jgi:hypothetical protein